MNGSKWNRFTININVPCVCIRTVGTIQYGTAIRGILALLKERFYLESFRLVVVETGENHMEPSQKRADMKKRDDAFV